MKRIGSSNDLVKIPEVTKGADVSEKYIYSLGKEYDELGIPLMFIERQINVIKAKIKLINGPAKTIAALWDRDL